MSDDLINAIAENIEYNEVGKKRPMNVYVKWTIAVIRAAKAMGYELKKIS